MTRPEIASRSASWASVAGGLGAILVPKCALCFAAYGSALGALGLSPVTHERLVEALVVLAVAGSFALVLSARRRDAATPLASAGGAALVLAGRYALQQPAVTVAGALLLAAAALVNAARCRKDPRSRY